MIVQDLETKFRPVKFHNSGLYKKPYFFSFKQDSEKVKKAGRIINIFGTSGNI